MKMKKSWIVLSVTTQDALEACLEENTRVFCIENPLYSHIKDSLWKENRFSDYKIDTFPDKQIILMQKIRGKDPFDAEKYELLYLPLQWDNWHS